MTFLIIILLFIINVLGYCICLNYNNDIRLYKFKHTPFIWIFLFKYKKTYNKQEVLDLFYLYRNKYLLYRNIQILDTEFDVFIQENL